MTRVLVVDDSAFIRRAVERMLAGVPDVRIIGVGTNGREAVELVRELRPDVVIMDVNMPEMDGLEALRRIMAEAPTAVLLMSTLTQAGAEITLQALELGAVDFIDKGSVGTAMNIYDLGPVLRDKVLAVAETGSVRQKQTGGEAAATAPSDPAARPLPGDYEVVAIGASTGGPRALTELIPSLPAHFGAGVVVAQHMPAGFTGTLASRLDRRSNLRVSEARDRDAIVPGEVLIAPGRTQMTVERGAGGLLVRVSQAPHTLLHQPSVDLLFTSAAHAAGSQAVGVVLTGMGDDGAEGLRTLHDAGARTVVESPDTAVIYGMPRAARPFADTELPLHRIAPYLADLCRARGASQLGGV